jgi:hypothetical protein
MTAKLVLLSVIIASIAIPVFAARDANAMRSFKKTVALILAFNMLYVFLVRFIYPRLL